LEDNIKTLVSLLVGFLCVLCNTYTYGNDIVVFKFQDNRQQQIHLIEPSHNIKDIRFYSSSSTSGTTTPGTTRPPLSSVAGTPADYCSINIVSTEYGTNCGHPYNVFDKIAKECNGKTKCAGPVSNQYFRHDSAIGCGKDFTILYSCCGNQKRFTYLELEVKAGRGSASAHDVQKQLT
jgi:hypothetical protein